MAVETGLNWRVAIDVAESDGTPSWVTMPQEVGGTIAFSKSSLDATNKDNSGDEDEVSNRRGWTVSIDGHNADNNSAIEYLIDTNQLHATDIDTPVHLRLTNAAGDTFIGWATMESFEYDFGESSLVTFSASFKGRARDNTGVVSKLTLTRA